MKIIDCFTFYNELDLLTYRLNILYDVVDYFVLVEATHTHVGLEKSLYYNENKHLFEKFHSKIIHVIVSNLPHKYPNINCNNGEQWVNERFQRDCISNGISRLNLDARDYITITDLDEIPDPRILAIIKENRADFEIYALEMEMYYYNLNCRHLGELWTWPKIISYKTYIELNEPCSRLRFWNCGIVRSAGWHLSYFGDATRIQNKIQNFAHQEFNNSKFTDIDKINDRISKGVDLYDRENQIVYVPISENEYLPVRYDEFLTRYYS